MLEFIGGELVLIVGCWFVDGVFVCFILGLFFDVFDFIIDEEGVVWGVGVLEDLMLDDLWGIVFFNVVVGECGEYELLLCGGSLFFVKEFSYVDEICWF